MLRELVHQCKEVTGAMESATIASTATSWGTSAEDKCVHNAQPEAQELISKIAYTIYIT